MTVSADVWVALVSAGIGGVGAAVLTSGGLAALERQAIRQELEIAASVGDPDLADALRSNAEMRTLGYLANQFVAVDPRHAYLRGLLYSLAGMMLLLVSAFTWQRFESLAIVSLVGCCVLLLICFDLILRITRITLRATRARAGERLVRAEG